MLSQSKLVSLILGVALVAVMHGDAFAQRGPGYGRGAGFRGGRGPGQGGDPQFAIDRDDFHFLLGHHEEIDRTVKKTKKGIATVTESDNPEVAAKIQEHVAAMYDRVKNVKPIHMRDPLFAELFRHADKIQMKHEDTEKGVKVIETSKDPHVVKLLQTHADTVSLFIKNGFAEAQRNHAVPGADDTVTVSTEVPAKTACSQCPNAATCPSAKKQDAGCAGCPNAATCPSAKKQDAGCAGCPNAATCPSAKKQDAGCADCPNAATCPSAKKKDTGCAGCPNAATCPSAKKQDAGCAGCPNAATCPSAKKQDAGCAGCPNAATCPSAKKSANAAKCPLSDVCPLAGKCPGSDKCPLEKAEKSTDKKKSANKKKDRS